MSNLLDKVILKIPAVKMVLKRILFKVVNLVVEEVFKYIKECEKNNNEGESI